MDSVYRFIDSMTSAVQVADSVEGFLQELCAGSCVEHATFQMVIASANRLAVPYVKTTYSENWIRFYLLNNLMKVDPVIRYAQSEGKSFFWSEIVLSHAEKLLMQNAKNFGISSAGFTVPTVDVGPYRGLFSICAGDMVEDDWQRHIEGRRREFEHIAHRLHFLARTEIDPYASYAANLSRREIECLRFISEGKTHTDMAEIMGISEHTVRSYCRALRLKLNCSTLAQAVAKAFSMGLL
ncbi:autoinducer binding domain-containing protein [Fulvimarina sp. MAC3]|uniref:helix-turn-helix transcriptional regulator n=1 Tax=Fulvimarina sp. MAC3 TaxID=3148887 RepID=UPI0031FE06E1